MIFDRHKLQRILIASAVILLLALGGGWLLPKSWPVERQVLIAAPPAAVFADVNSLKRWRQWAAWDEREPGLVFEYSGPEAGVGATRRWKSERGRGVLKIMDNQRDRKVEYEMLTHGGAVSLSGAIRLLPEDRGTRVVWRATVVGGTNPIERYLALVDKVGLERDIDASLARLKARLEASQ